MPSLKKAHHRTMTMEGGIAARFLPKDKACSIKHTWRGARGNKVCDLHIIVLQGVARETRTLLNKRFGDL